MEEVAIEVSDVILGPPSETPYHDLEYAILRRSQPRKAGCVTLLLLQQSAVLRLSEPLRICYRPSGENALALHSHLEVSLSYEPVGTVTATQQGKARSTPYASVVAAEFTCAEKLQDIPEPTTYDLFTVHPGCLHLPSIALPTMHKQTELFPLCPLTIRARAKPFCTISRFVGTTLWKRFINSLRNLVSCKTVSPWDRVISSWLLNINSQGWRDLHVWNFCDLFLTWGIACSRRSTKNTHLWIPTSFMFLAKKSIILCVYQSAYSLSKWA